MRIARQSSPQAHVDMLPLMDCMFLLLVFFVYAMISMVVHQGIPVNLPQAATAVLNKDVYVAITITKDGNYYINKSKRSLAQVNAYFLDLKKDKKDPNIYINADQGAQHGWVIGILDEIRRQGFTKVSFETSGEQK